MTPEDIMKKFANDHSYDTWGELMYDTHEHIQIEYTKEVMIIYAEQQNSALVKYPIGMDGYPNKNITYCYSCGSHVKNQKYCKGCGRKLIWNLK